MSGPHEPPAPPPAAPVGCPSDEGARLRALAAYQILDTPPEQAYDDLAALAAQICGTPVAAVMFVDDRRQWAKAAVGIENANVSRTVSFCARAVDARAPLVVEDALADPRFADNPLVTGPPHLRFYAGVPLVTTEGFVLGTVCVMDTVPHPLDAAQLRALHALSRQATGQLELRRSSAALAAELDDRRVRERDLARLAAIVDGASEAIIGKTLDGVVTSWNPAAQKIYGHSAAEAIGQRISFLLPPDRPHEIDEILAKLRRGERVERLETVRMRKDGTSVDVSLTISPICEPDGSLTGAASMAHDITLEKLAEAELARAFAAHVEANERLRRVDAVKSDFVSIVSHEFRTPLTVIQGFSEMMSREGLAPDEVREYAADIHAEAQRLARLISDMLDLDRIESGKMPMHFEPVDLNAVLAGTAEVIARIAPRHRLVLRLDDAPAMVRGDADRLRQVATNLLSNAVKYSSGGEIVVRSVVDDDVVRASVQDSGAGIPADALETIFERYGRVNSAATRKIVGTGLGLPISRHIVQLHGGRLWAESTPGVGSVFHLTLPALAPRAE